MMIEKLLTQFPRINVRVVEPFEEHVVQFKSLAKSRSDQLLGVNFDWRQQTFEQYQKAGDPTKFHFISAVHVISHLDDWESSLMYLYNCLEPYFKNRAGRLH